MNLRSPQRFEQEAAQSTAAGAARLADCALWGSVIFVGSAPKPGGVSTARVPSHTPSLYGRRRHTPGPSSVFSAIHRITARSRAFVAAQNRQSFADFAAPAARPLAVAADGDVLSFRATRKRGYSCSTEHQPRKFGSLPPSAPQRSAPAVTRSRNGRFTAPARALPQRPLSMATLAPAQLPALRPTSLTANFTRHAADAALTSVRAVPVRHQELNPTPAARRGGVFVAMCPGSLRPDAKLEGTRNVQ